MTIFSLAAYAFAMAQGIQVKLATGTNHGVLLKADGTVWTWGSNALGQLGSDGDYSWEALPVEGLSRIRDVAAGDSFTLAVRQDGTVWGWGENSAGQLGDRSVKNSSTPTRIAGLTDVVAVAAGGAHALSLRSDGSVWEWGESVSQGTVVRLQQVQGVSGVIAIAASTKHNVVLKSDGTVWVWGDHGAGDLGNGFYGISASPLQLRGLSDVKAVGAGYQLTLALKKDGTVWAVGYGAAGQLGNGSTENSYKPVRVSGLADVKAVAAGYMHALALKEDGTVWSWGYNHEGQLGNLRVAQEQSLMPVRSGPLSGVVAIAASSRHSTAVTRAGVLWAWGQNEEGALGADDEKLRRSEVPMRVGQDVPNECHPLFSCSTDGGKYIQICGEQLTDDISKWSHLQYRFGPGNGPPEFMFPKDAAKAGPSLFFSHEETSGDYLVSIRFSNGAYTYRVFSGSESGAGVEVDDAGGKKLSVVRCNEKPAIWPEYLRLALPCDPRNPHGAAACKEAPFQGK